MDRRQYLGLVGITSLAGCTKVAKFVGPAGRAADDAVESPTRTETVEVDEDVQDGVDVVVSEDGPNPAQGANPIYTIDSRETIDVLDHLTWSLDLQSEVAPSRETVSIDYRVVVRNGPEIDVYLIEQSEYQHYITGENFVYEEHYSDENTKLAEASGQVSVKDYYLLLANTQTQIAGTSSSNNQDAEVTVELTVE